LVKNHPLEIISVDSVMVYKGLDIGSAKPTSEELKLCPHHLIDVCEPTENYSAGEFYQDVQQVIQSIIRKGKIPFLVGGTMMYFRVLERGISQLPSANPSVRKQIDSEAAANGWAKLHQELQRIDPTAAKKIDPSDKQRIQRALEVHRITGKPISSFHGEHKQPIDYQRLNLSLVPSKRDILYKRIENRFDAMLDQGLVSEVGHLLSKNSLTSSHNSMKSVGYKQICEFIENKCSLDEARAKAVVATRRLAKRQLTWLRSDTDSLVVDPLHRKSEVDIEGRVSQFLN
jgi:tRNA dimethylallyltransferase